MAHYPSGIRVMLQDFVFMDVWMDGWISLLCLCLLIFCGVRDEKSTGTLKYWDEINAWMNVLHLVWIKKGLIVHDWVTEFIWLSR